MSSKDVSVISKLIENRKMKNCIFEKHKFQMKLISYWFASIQFS